MWTRTSRRHHSRAALRYGSDLTDAEWMVLEPLLPPPCACGRKRRWPMRRIVEAILYIMRAGCTCDMLPDGFPPFLTVYRWFARFRDDGTWERINHQLVMLDRERVGREASPSAAIMDSQSAKTTEAGGPSGYDAGKKVKGRKRHALVDTDGRLIKVIVHPADIQDRDGGVMLLKASRRSFPFVELVFADSAYAGKRVTDATCITVQIVRKAEGQVGFKLHKRRWTASPSFPSGGSPAALGRGTLLRLDRPQPPLLPRCRTARHLRASLHLRRILHHPAAPTGPLIMRSEMASEVVRT